MLPDPALEKEVRQALQSDPDLDPSEITVAAAEGVVTLIGVVGSEAERRLAERDAKQVPGVLGVANDLDVRPPEHSDAAIAHLAAMALRHELPYSHRFIELAVDGGWVTLEGAVEWHYQKEDAELTLRELKELAGVTNNLVVEHWVDPAEIQARIAQDALG